MDSTRTAVLVGAALAAALLVGLFVVADAGLVLATLRQAHVGAVGAVLAVHVAAIVLRVIRWRALLAAAGVLPGSSDRAADRWLIADSVFVGWLVNLCVPARLGDLGRPVLYARRSGRSATTVLVTVGIERLSDVGAIGLLGLAGIALAPPLPGLDPRFAQAVNVTVAASLLALGVGVLVLRRWRPGAGDGRTLARTAGLTGAIWGAELVAVDLCLRAVGADAGLAISACVLVATTLAVSIVTVPGGLGVEQGTTVAVLMPFGATLEAALAGGLLLTLTAAFWVVPLGLLGLWRQRSVVQGRAEVVSEERDKPVGGSQIVR